MNACRLQLTYEALHTLPITVLTCRQTVVIVINHLVYMAVLPTEDK